MIYKGIGSEVFTMIIYHGSPEIIEVPTYGRGSETNDYGRGFYCTENIELAKEWSCPTVKNGFSNKYELDISDLSIRSINPRLPKLA